MYSLDSFWLNLVQYYPIDASLCCLPCFALLLKHFPSLFLEVHHPMCDRVSCASAQQRRHMQGWQTASTLWTKWVCPRLSSHGSSFLKLPTYPTHKNHLAIAALTLLSTPLCITIETDWGHHIHCILEWVTPIHPSVKLYVR